MKEEIKSEGKFSYVEKGEGTPIIILHGLMGGLSNFDGVANFFPCCILLNNDLSDRNSFNIAVFFLVAFQISHHEF